MIKETKYNTTVIDSLVKPIRKLRMYLYNPNITYQRDKFSSQVRNYVADTDQEIVAKYTIPNSIVPQLHTKFIIATKSLIIQKSDYSELEPIPYTKFESIQQESSGGNNYATIKLIDDQLISIKFESEHSEFFELLENNVLSYSPKSDSGGENDEIEKYIENKIEGIKEIEQNRRKQDTEENSSK